LFLTFFVDDEYQAALEHYTMAIKQDDSLADYFSKRAAVHIKLKNFTSDW
jgi:hypothetical protein